MALVGLQKSCTARSTLGFATHSKLSRDKLLTIARIPALVGVDLVGQPSDNGLERTLSGGLHDIC